MTDERAVARTRQINPVVTVVWRPELPGYDVVFVTARGEWTFALTLEAVINLAAELLFEVRAAQEDESEGE